MTAGGWRASRSCDGGACVEVGWRTASRSTHNGACAEAASGGGLVLVRDSADRGGPVLRFTPAAWRAFLGGPADVTAAREEGGGDARGGSL